MRIQHKNPDDSTVEVSVGNDVTLGYGGTLGNDVTLGDRVTLSNRQIICAGRDSRNWEVLGLALPNGLIITAGCRWFDMSGARQHWTDNPEMLRKLNYIETEVAARKENVNV